MDRSGKEGTFPAGIAAPWEELGGAWEELGGAWEELGGARRTGDTKRPESAITVKGVRVRVRGLGLGLGLGLWLWLEG